MNLSRIALGGALLALATPAVAQARTLHETLTTPIASGPYVRIKAEGKFQRVRNPLPRTIEAGRSGLDVKALQRALILCRVRPPSYGTPGNYGVRTRAEVLRVQHAHRVPMSGNYGPITHAIMAHCFDAYGVVAMRNLWLDQKAKRLALSVQAKRAKFVGAIVSTARYAVSQGPAIHYSQGGLRMTDFAPPPNVPNYTDCSGFVTWVYKTAHLTDPNGFGYAGYGYTGTLATHGVRVYGVPEAGDLVFYGGGWPYTHVAVGIGNGMVVSQGSEGGPYILRYDYRPVSQVRRYF